MKKFKRLVFKIKKRGIAYVIMPKSVIIFKYWSIAIDEHLESLFQLHVGNPEMQKVLDSERIGRHMDRLHKLYLKQAQK